MNMNAIPVLDPPPGIEPIERRPRWWGCVLFGHDYYTADLVGGLMYCRKCADVLSAFPRWKIKG